MKKVNRYSRMKARHQLEVNEFPMSFAFNQKQLEEGLIKLGLEPTDTDKVCSIPGGGFIRKTDVDDFIDMMKRHAEEMDEAVKEDQDGTGFIYEMFLNELANHEFSYTGEYDDTLMALNLTIEEVRQSPALKNGMLKAANRILGFDVVENSPEP